MENLADSVKGVGGQNVGGKSDHKMHGSSGEAVETRGRATGGGAGRLTCESRL